MPTLSKRNNTPKPRKSDPNKEIRSSLKIWLPPSLLDFEREISYTKNHAVKMVPIAIRIVARPGKIAGLMGDTYRIIPSDI